MCAYCSHDCGRIAVAASTFVFMALMTLLVSGDMRDVYCSLFCLVRKIVVPQIDEFSLLRRSRAVGNVDGGLVVDHEKGR